MEGEPDDFQHAESSFGQRVAPERSDDETAAGKQTRQFDQEWQSSAFARLHSARFGCIRFVFNPPIIDWPWNEVIAPFIQPAHTL